MEQYSIIKFAGQMGYQIVPAGRHWQPAFPGIPYTEDGTGFPLWQAHEQVQRRMDRDRRCACACPRPALMEPGG